MISQLNNTVVSNTYAKTATDTKEVSKKGTNISSQGDMSKINQIKEALESGEYKINLNALSEKIADELL